jgi:hypothetical protein
MKILKYIFNKQYRENKREVNSLMEAKQQADQLHEATGFKYYVLSWGKGYKAVNMVWVNMMKKQKLLPKQYDAIRLEKYSVYVTK